ncbi:substrate-binding domain-containing protein [Spirochaeta lutea]|uniref:histidine kinase n=1 Tax=Spirochaeta lutea TaxID=1480694 RepID=A0A098QUF1_9SPIO|nr:substrate-binding domain-containing protein [Spirochaeta lutea]KGE71211.1 hypothetical protein DC28_12200 [Spirochaeta lutea]
MSKNTLRVAVIVPTLLFKIDQEICIPAVRALEKVGIQAIVVSGGYFSAQGYEDEPGVWIYERVRQLDVHGFLVYSGGLGYASGPKKIHRFMAALYPRPVVSIGMSFPGVPSILADNYTGMHDLTREIVSKWAGELHNRPCAFVLGPQDNQEAQHRYQGWRDALREVSMEPADHQIVQGDFTGPGGQRAADALLNSTEPLPRLVFCANDLTAFGVISRLREAGFRVPEDVAVAGFDDFEYAGAFQGGLTSVHYPAREMGQLAAEHMLTLLDGSEAEEISVAASHPVYRGSMPASPGGYDPQRVEDVESLRAMLHEEISIRDMQHSRILVDQLFFKQEDLNALFSQAGQLLDQSGISRLWCCRTLEPVDRDHLLQVLNESPQELPIYLAETVSISDYRRYPGTERPSQQQFPGNSMEFIDPRQVLPEEEDLSDGRNSAPVLVPLGVGNEVYGYLVCMTDVRVMGIPETIGLQVAGVMKRLWMVEEALRRQRILESTREQLDRAERIAGLGRLVAGISHEINTPIGSGLTLATFLGDRITEILQLFQENRLGRSELARFLDQAGNAAEGMTESLNRIVGLMENFRSLSSDVTNQLKRRFMIRGVIENAIIRSIAQDRGRVDLRVSCSPGLDMYGDPEVFDAIVSRLVSNTLEHGYKPDQPVRILVSLRHASQGRLVFRYRDYGRGLTHEELQGVFEPFFTTRRGRGNTGLGMFIVHTLTTQALRGSIRIDSRPKGGRGILVTIFFPRQTPGSSAESLELAQTLVTARNPE